MWRPTFTILQKVVLPSFRDNLNLSKLLFSTKSRLPKSTSKLTLVSASIGVLVGAGYGGYTHYKVNVKKTFKPGETEEYAFLKEAPEYAAHYKIINDADTSNLQLTLFQYRTCPFCCKVRAYLDARGISYEIVEVDAVLRQAIKWSGYKKVPILLAKVDGGYQQLLDSTAIISVLETYLKDKTSELRELIKFYPVTKFVTETGNESTDIANKYFIMHQANVPDEKEKALEAEERQWRQWADRVLVNTLSPNVYRTAGEALETFQWFEQAGGWRQFFPAWECTLMVYIGAAAMYMISKRLKTRHKIKDDPRESLYDAVNEWMGAVQSKGTPFLGGDKPNLADVTVFGVLSSIEGCTAFQDLKKNTAVEKWYFDTKNAIERRMGKVIAMHA
ncbi:prostaglandin E synthase 2 [Spodoptera frugiperda]|uniref:Prostaglandin E synthase 2 n=1 Tax=Spodoptera frugiperda TaxID=7108 RepID=A0A9R0EG13_SPOFR|nr:prostaglandin E synthase 2 [Spodoptera frugiperda]